MYIHKMAAKNTMNTLYDTLLNTKENGIILEAMTNVTNAVGEIAELSVASAAESNMYDVYVGTFNHYKIAHAKKSVVCNYVQGATASDDTFIYDLIVKYNNTNSSALKTVLCSLDFSPFVKIADEDRDAAVTGELDNSANISIDWSKLEALKDISSYLTVHQNFHNSVTDALIAVKPFAL
jgi:hypothetical protein